MEAKGGLNGKGGLHNNDDDDSKVNVEIKMKLTLMKNCECLG
jgi:hypothetical protein